MSFFETDTIFLRATLNVSMGLFGSTGLGDGFLILDDCVLLFFLHELSITMRQLSRYNKGVYNRSLYRNPSAHH